MPSSFSPPLFHQSESCGLGFIVKGSNLAGSLAGLVSRSGEGTSFAGDFEPSIFGQVSYKPSEEAKLTMSGMWQTCKPSQVSKLGSMTSPGISSNRRKAVKSSPEGRSSGAPSNSELIALSSVALMVESQFDESNSVGCWVEMWKSSPSLFEWGASLSDVPADEVGWGLRLGGRIEGSFNQIWMEGFLSFSLGKKAVLQPGILYPVGGECRTPALLLRSTWFM